MNRTRWVEHRHWVGVGGHHLALVTAGAGRPTIVCESGAGSPRGTWAPLWPGLTDLSLSCCYDRAGLGQSEPGPLPRGSIQVADELRRALALAEIPGPYLLVGEALGGHHIRVFAGRYPADVAGLVLADPATEYAADYLRARVSPEIWARMVAAEAEALAAMDLPPGVAAEHAPANLDLCAEQVKATPIPPELPLVVLTSATQPSAPGFPVDLNAMIWELHAGIAQTSRRSQHLLVKGSTNMVEDRPDALLVAVRYLVEQARQGGSRGAAKPGADTVVAAVRSLLEQMRQIG